MLQLTVLVLFPLLMVYAAFSDLLTMTIANWVSVLLVVGFTAVALAAGMPASTVLTGHLACGGAVLALTFALFAFGWIGGGDAKLAAATAVWLGWDHLYDYGLEASFLGGLLTLAIVAWRKYDMPPALLRPRWIARLHSAANGVPYGIALAVTGLALYPDTSAWSMAAS